MAFATDTIIYPMESQMFGERKIGSDEMVPFVFTDLYKNDLIGLKTLTD